MLFLILMWISISGTVGGGAFGKGAGIAPIIITGVGVIMEMSQVFIMMWIRGGEDTTGIVIGTDTGGAMSGSLTEDFNRTGKVGIIIDIGKEIGPGACRAINLGRNHRDRN
jgi:hypothetical protein